MNKLVKIVLLALLGILALLIVLPIAFKGKIEEVVNREINKQLNATVSYNELSLSMLKNFPNLSLGISELSVVGQQAFENDTLVYLKDFTSEIGLLGAMSGKISVASLQLDDVLVNARVLADSTANWDIVKSTGEEVEEVTPEEESSSDFTIELQHFAINNATIRYTDETAQLASEIEGLNVKLSGDMSASETNLQLFTEIKALMVKSGDITYVDGATLGLDAGLAANLDQMKFGFLENTFRINGMELNLDGDVTMKEVGYGLNLEIGTKNTDFKSLLAMVPKAFLSDFEGLRTAGDMTLEASIKGDYVDDNQWPAIDAVLEVKDGQIQYPELPKSIDAIGVLLKVKNPGGAADLTTTNLEQFHFELDKSPFDASMVLTTPMSNPTFKAKAHGRLDLGALAQAVPMDSIELKGLIETKLDVEGDYNTIEAEDYEKIKAKGQMGIKNFAFNSPDVPQRVEIPSSEMTVTPKSLSLKSFNCKMGDSDFTITGSLENYLSYALKDGTLKGRFAHTSRNINTNAFIPEEETTEGADSISEPLEVIEVPKNLDLVFSSKIDHLVYDKLEIKKINGQIVVKNGRVQMNGLNMRLLNGSLTMKGQYNTADMTKPFVDFEFTGSNLDVNMAANSFSVVDSMMPIAKKAAGLVSPKFSYYGVLGKDMMPVMTTVNGGGNLKSEGIKVEGSKIQNNLASTLKNDKYKVMKAEDLNINFLIEKGNIIVKPFKTKVGGQVMTVQGRQGVDQSIDYLITMPVSRKEVAGMAGLMGFNLPTSGSDLMVDVIVKGTVKEPIVSFNLDKAQKQVGKELEKEAGRAVEKLLNDPGTQKAVEGIMNMFKKKKK